MKKRIDAEVSVSLPNGTQLYCIIKIRYA